MKIRTGFVSNSSSSSFVLAPPNTIDWDATYIARQQFLHKRVYNSIFRKLNSKQITKLKSLFPECLTLKNIGNNYLSTSSGRKLFIRYMNTYLKYSRKYKKEINQIFVDLPNKEDILREFDQNVKEMGLLDLIGGE